MRASNEDPQQPLPTMPTPISFYFDLLSPFAYLASMRIHEVAQRHGRTVDWCPVLVGVTVMKVMGMRPLPEYPLKGPYLHHDAQRQARWLGIPFKFHAVEAPTSVLGLRSFLWLKQHQPALAVPLAQRLFHRLWVDGRDIGSAAAVAEEAGALGLDGDSLVRSAGEADTRRALQQAVEEAISRGVFGVPFFRADGEGLWGVDRLPMLEHWLRHGTWDAPVGIGHQGS